MLEMYKGLVNSPETTITNDINAEDTIIYVLDETKVPEELPNLMTLGTGTSAETVKVLEVNGNALTVERGFQGTPRSWNAGTVIARNFTEYDYNALKENIEYLEATKETPQGAQEKADAALNSAKQYTDQEVGEVAQELAAHKAENVHQKEVHGLRIEEGTFTPTIIFNDDVPTGVVFSRQVGVYRRIGKRIEFTISIETSTFTHSFTNETLGIYSLPFPIAPNQFIALTGYVNRFTKAGYTHISSRIWSSGFSNRIVLCAIGSGQNWETIKAKDLPSGTNVTIEISGSYLTN